jgi:hypothetical protein
MTTKIGGAPAKPPTEYPAQVPYDASFHRRELYEFEIRQGFRPRPKRKNKRKRRSVRESIAAAGTVS